MIVIWQDTPSEKPGSGNLATIRQGFFEGGYSLQVFPDDMGVFVTGGCDDKGDYTDVVSVGRPVPGKAAGFALGEDEFSFVLGEIGPFVHRFFVAWGFLSAPLGHGEYAMNRAL